MKKTKVAHLFNEINFSGAEIMYAQAAHHLQENGFELIAVSTGRKLGNYIKQYQQANFKIYHMPVASLSIFNLWKFITYYVSFYQFLKTEHIDVLHIHRSNLVFVALIAWLAKVRCIKTQHSTFKNRWFTLPYAIVWRYILRVFFNVNFQAIGKSVYFNELHYYRNPSTLINNWFDIKKFYPAKNDEEKVQIRRHLDIPQEAFVVISTGSCSNIKNHHDIIKAMSLVKDKINCIYLHLGQGAMEQKEMQFAVDLGVSHMIRFLGNQDSVRDFLVVADIYLMTSKFEGLGNAALEAMACRLPCVLYNVPGLRDLIKNDDNGFLIEPDYRLLADKIIDVQQSPLTAIEKANNALLFVLREFSMPVNVQKIMELYRN